MRLNIIVLFGFFIVLGLVHPWTWDWTWGHLEGKIRAEIFSLDQIPKNISVVTEDLADMVDHPTLERLQARAYVARALASCDNVCFAIEEEIDDFSAAIRLDPKYARAYLYRAVGRMNIYHRANGRFDEKAQSQIISDLSMAIRLDPHGKRTANAYDLLATEYECGLQQHDKAIEVCNMAIANLPAEKARSLYRFRGWLYGKHGEQQKEISDYQDAKQLDSNFQWLDRWRELQWQLRWNVWLILVLIPLSFWISKRVTPASAL